MPTPAIYYEFTSPVVAGTTVRSDKYNNDQLALQTAFEQVAQDTFLSLQVPSGWTAAKTLAAQPSEDSLITLKANGQFDWFSVALLNQGITNVELWRNETEQFRNEAAGSAAAAAGYASTVGVPVIVAAGGSFDIPEEQPAIEIVCLGNADITFPDLPGVNAKYVVKSTDKDAVVTVTLGTGHQITDSKGVLQPSAVIEGLYQLDAHWLGAGVYRGF